MEQMQPLQEQPKGGPVCNQASNDTWQQSLSQARDNCKPISPLLQLPPELQLQIYDLVFFDNYSEGVTPIIYICDCRGVERNGQIFAPDEPGLFKRTVYFIPSQDFSPEPAVACEMSFPRPEIGLLSICRAIRTMVVPLFYGRTRFELWTREEIVPFFSDLGLMARYNIKDLRIDRVQLGCEGSDVEQDLWERNFNYMHENLVNLKSLSVESLDWTLMGNMRDDNIGRVESLHEMGLTLENMKLERPDLKWLRALANLRGLSTFNIKLQILFEDTWTIDEGSASVQALLRQYLSSKVCQPRITKDGNTTP
ncbi:hypothetical protein ACLMJK_005768 [Lecanora helva]